MKQQTCSDIGPSGRKRETKRKGFPHIMANIIPPKGTVKQVQAAMRKTQVFACDTYQGHSHRKLAIAFSRNMRLFV